MFDATAVELQSGREFEPGSEIGSKLHELAKPRVNTKRFAGNSASGFAAIATVSQKRSDA